MNKELIKIKVEDIIKDILGIACVDLDDGKILRDEYNMDSLDAIEIVIEIENEFNIEISDAILTSKIDNDSATSASVTEFIIDLVGGH